MLNALMEERDKDVRKAHQNLAAELQHYFETSTELSMELRKAAATWMAINYHLQRIPDPESGDPGV